jgi:hypothetical protein
MRKVLATLVLLLLLSGSITFNIHTVVVVANTIDYSSELVEYLQKSFTVIIITPGEFWSYQQKDYQYYIVLGGPDAPFGTAEIVRTLLPVSDQERLRTPGEYTMATVTQEKTYFIIAGYDRESTRTAVNMYMRDIPDYIPKGTITWLKDLNITRVTGMVMTDLNNDGVYDFVIAGHRKVYDPFDRAALYVYHGDQLHWYYHLQTPVEALACYDIDGDGSKEIIAACDILRDMGDLYVFDGNGKLKWQRRVPGAPRSLYCYPGGVGVNVYGQGERVQIFDAAGAPVADLAVNGSISNFIIEDINNDGVRELAASGILDNNWEHFFVVYNLDGTVLWNYQPFEHINDFEFYDIDNDGIEETILASYDSVYITRGGDLLGKVHLPPGLLKVKVIQDQLLVVNHNTMFLLDLYTLRNLKGVTVPYSEFPQVVTAHQKISVRPDFLFLEDIDFDDVTEIIVGNGEILHIHELSDFESGVEGFVTAPLEEAEEIPEEQFAVYENVRKRIKITYLKEWTVNEPGIENIVVVFSSSIGGPWDTFQETLSIAAEPVSAQTTLDEYTESRITTLKETISNFQVVEEASTILAGLPAYSIVYTGKMNEQNLKWMQLWTIKDETAFVIVYTASQSQYESFLGIIQRMMGTFEILEKAAVISICDAQFDAPGDDNENLNKEWVKLCNNTSTDIDMSGWGLLNDVGAYYEFPEGFILKANSIVFVYTGTGTDTDIALYWGRPLEAWNNEGDIATLMDRDGTIIAEYKWTPE